MYMQLTPLIRPAQNESYNRIQLIGKLGKTFLNKVMN